MVFVIRPVSADLAEDNDVFGKGVLFYFIEGSLLYHSHWWTKIPN